MQYFYEYLFCWIFNEFLEYGYKLELMVNFVDFHWDNCILKAMLVQSCFPTQIRSVYFLWSCARYELCLQICYIIIVTIHT